MSGDKNQQILLTKIIYYSNLLHFYLFSFSKCRKIKQVSLFDLHSAAV